MCVLLECIIKFPIDAYYVSLMTYVGKPGK